MSFPWMNTYIRTTEGRFRVSVYLPTIDICLNQLERRFESLKVVVNNCRLDSCEEELPNMVATLVSKYADHVFDDLFSQLLPFLCCRIRQNGTGKQQQC